MKPNSVKNRMFPCAAIAAVFFLAACNKGIGPEEVAPGEPMASDASVIFLHHSTGGVIWDGGVESSLASHNSANGKSYTITELAYPDGATYPWANYPYDYWHFWVDG